jgi:hypothetical protein
VATLVGGRGCVKVTRAPGFSRNDEVTGIVVAVADTHPSLKV